MGVFVFSVAVVLVTSAFCSLSEAAIYAVRRPYIMTLAESGSLTGRWLAKFKDNMELPISAILIVNTAANTAGAAVAGYQVKELFGEVALIPFTATFTLAVLLFSEIIPKVVGVVYCRGVASMVALPWAGAIRMLFPLIWLVQKMTHVLKPKDPILSAPEEEVHQLAVLSAEEGSILPIEAELVKNVLKLNEVSAGDILTPRSVVMTLPADMTIREAADSVKVWNVSRIPIFEGEPENWVGVVWRDVLTALSNDQFDTKLETYRKPIHFVPEQAPGHLLLGEFLKKRMHLFAVVDEYGGIEGVVTLEDVMESLLGREIVDEVDTAEDMQEVARSRHRNRLKKQKPSDRSDGDA